jgi:tRNA acetyltransferase TAN1
VLHIDPTEKFDLIVMFYDDYNNVEDDDLEIIGIEEMEDVLEDINIKFYVKESVCPNVVLVELGMNALDTALKLKNTPTKKIARALPINKVVKTNFNVILNTIKEISLEKICKGESFAVRCDVMSYNKFKAQDLIDAVSYLMINFGFNIDENNPEWNIYIEVIGENTGISILNSNNFSEH